MRTTTIHVKGTRLLLLAIVVIGCDRTHDLAVDHLRSLGYKEVFCAGEEAGDALCSADGNHFRCVTAAATGCASSATACERFVIERASP